MDARVNTMHWGGSSAARPCGTCFRCGGQLYENLVHHCGSTAAPVTAHSGWWNPLAPIPRTDPVQKGWLCPACGKGNAPWNPTCGHCRGARQQ